MSARYFVAIPEPEQPERRKPPGENFVLYYVTELHPGGLCPEEGLRRAEARQMRWEVAVTLCRALERKAAE